MCFSGSAVLGAYRTTPGKVHQAVWFRKIGSSFPWPQSDILKWHFWGSSHKMHQARHQELPRTRNQKSMNVVPPPAPPTPRHSTLLFIAFSLWTPSVSSCCGNVTICCDAAFLEPKFLGRDFDQFSLGQWILSDPSVVDIEWGFPLPLWRLLWNQSQIMGMERCGKVQCIERMRDWTEFCVQKSCQSSFQSSYAQLAKTPNFSSLIHS